MTATQARTTRETLCRFALGDPALVTESITKVGFGTASSAGAADGTTLIDTSGAAVSGAATKFAGEYWVRILSGNNKGTKKRVITDDGAGTLTFEGNGFPNQVASGVQYEVLLMPDPGCVVVDRDARGTTQGGTPTTTAFSDNLRDEADDFWVGYYAIPIKGALIGEVQKITAFDTAGGATEGLFTCEAFTAAPANGDVILLRKYAEIGSFAGGFEQSVLERRSKRVNFSQGAGVVGAKGAGPVTFETDAFAVDAQSAAAAVASRNVLGDLMEMCGMVLEADTAMTVGAGSTTTAITVSTGTHELTKIGHPVQYMGHTTIVQSKTDGGVGVDTLNVLPALPSAPVAADVLNVFRNYVKTLDGDTKYGIIEVEIDGVRHTFFNCKGSFTYADGQPSTFTWSFQYEDYAREIEAAPENPDSATTSAYPSVPFVADHDKCVWVDNVAADIGGFTCAPDVEVTPRAVSGRYGINGRAGHQVTDFKGGSTHRELLLVDEDLTRELDFQAQTERDLLVVWSSHERAIVFRMPAATIMQAPHPEDADGLQDVPVVLVAKDAGTASDPTDGIRKIPDWMFSIAG